MEPTLLFVITAAMFVVVGAAVVIGHYTRLDKKKYKSPYLRCGAFFEPNEFRLYRTLIEVCGGQYLVFPYVHLGRLLEVKPQVDWKDKDNVRSRVDRKPADFVLCRSDNGDAVAVVEVGADRHNFPNKQALDKFVDDLSQIEGLPLVHLSPSMTGEAVRTELQKVLSL